MAPAKAARNGAHDDSKSETPSTKEKNGGAGAHHSNGKLRRVASSTGSNLREVTNAGAIPGPTSAPSGVAASSEQQAVNPGLQWPAFPRDVLHEYRRAYRLNTPTAFKNDAHQWILTQPGSIGLYSPTIARRKELRRQSKDQLTNTARKHFNGLGVQENDVIVDFLHKIRSGNVTKGKKRKADQAAADLEG